MPWILSKKPRSQIWVLKHEFPFYSRDDMLEEITFHPDIIFVKNIETVFRVWKCLELIWDEFA